MKGRALKYFRNAWMRKLWINNISTDTAIKCSTLQEKKEVVFLLGDSIFDESNGYEDNDEFLFVILKVYPLGWREFWDMPRACYLPVIDGAKFLIANGSEPIKVKKQCPEFPWFGASYPDARCIDGYLWDLDKYEDGHLYGGGDQPCPFCNRKAFIDYHEDNEAEGGSREAVRNYIHLLNKKYNS